LTLWVKCGSNSKWGAFLDAAVESSPGDAKYNVANKTESELGPVKCTGWREVPDSRPLVTWMERRSHDLPPFCLKPGGLVLRWGLVLLTTTPVPV